MAGWNEVLFEISHEATPVDKVRRKYLMELSKYTGRNTIAYYSNFLKQSDQVQLPNLDINDSDMEGFMNAVKDLNCDMGLDLILHTPGGSPTAAESIVRYLRDKFNYDIRIIVPHMAMSAGTMIACSGKEIIMGKQSSLGPIDPQFKGIPAYNIKKEFEDAQKDLASHPKNAQYWAIKLQQYPAAFMKSAIDAIDLSEELIKEWLSDCMLKDNPSTVKAASKFLSDHGSSKVHARHYSYETCRNHGLKVKLMEDDQELQDKILSVHHVFMVTFDQTNSVKIIGNNLGKDYISALNNDKVKK